MRFQTKPYSCGAAAIVNALRCFGKRISERQIQILANTSKEYGTSEDGISNAIKSLGLIPTRFESNDKELAWNKVIKNFPIILCVMNSNHWVTTIGTIDDRIIIVDPTNTLLNKSENGIHIVRKQELLKYWKNKENKYFGVICSRR